jgi:hypothetical protein
MFFLKKVLGMLKVQVDSCTKTLENRYDLFKYSILSKYELIINTYIKKLYICIYYAYHVFVRFISYCKHNL